MICAVSRLTSRATHTTQCYNRDWQHAVQSCSGTQSSKDEHGDSEERRTAGHERWLDGSTLRVGPPAASVAAQLHSTKQADGRDDVGADGRGGVDRPRRAKLARRSRIGLGARSARTGEKQEQVRSKRQGIGGFQEHQDSERDGSALSTRNGWVPKVCSKAHAHLPLCKCTSGRSSPA